MKTKMNNTMNLEEFKNKHYGKSGTPQRDKFDQGYKNFKTGVLLHEARIKSGLTQQELADRAGTSKSYISKIENNIKEARLSTLQRIVELGLGGKLELSIVI